MTESAATDGRSSVAKVLVTLFWEMFKIALGVVGGGLAIAAVADEVFSRKLKWTKEGEIVGALPVVQMVPGLIAGNVAVYIGRKMAGWVGSAVAVTAVAMPSLAIFLAVSAGYAFLPVENPVLNGVFSGLRSALTAIVVVTMMRSWSRCVKGAGGIFTVVAAAFALFCGVNPAIVIVCAAFISLAAEFTPRFPVGEGRCFRSSPLAAAALVFLKYGSLAFGGGYVLVPFYLHDFVGASAPYVQLAEQDFSNLMALTQMTPGPIAVNAATFFGYRMCGVAGSLVATLCVLLPGALLMYGVLSSLERFRDSRALAAVMRGIRPVTVAMMAFAAWSFASMSVWTVGGGFKFHPFAAFIVLAAAAALLTRTLSVMKTITASAFAGAVGQLTVSAFAG